MLNTRGFSPKAILVCGSRDWSDGEIIKETLSSHMNPSKNILIHGDCRGADKLAQKASKEANFTTDIAVPAKWNEEGKAAGPKRNARMLHLLLSLEECGYEIEAFAFHLGGKGTQNMINNLKSAKVKTTIISPTKAKSNE